MRFRLSQPCHALPDEIAVEVGTSSKPLGQEKLGNVATDVVGDRCNQLSLRTRAEKADLDSALEQTGLDKVFSLVAVFFTGVDHLIGIDAGGRRRTDTGEEDQGQLVLLGGEDEADGKFVTRDDALNDGW